MTENGRATPRRQFLEQLGAIAATAGLAAPGSQSRSSGGDQSTHVPPSTHRPLLPWDMSWVDRVTAARYKAVLDVQEASDDPLYVTTDIIDRFREVYGTPDEETRVVLVMRRMSTPMALQDALWERYRIGEDRKIDDQGTKAPARRNPFLRAAPNEKETSTIEAKLEPLMARGTIVLVCNRAAMNFASRVAERLKRPVAEVQNEVRSGLAPGARLMPDGVFALVRAQNAGCAIYRDS